MEGIFMKKILLPVDGSDFCLKAYDMAKSFAEKFDAEIIVLNVADIEPGFTQTFITQNFQTMDEYLKARAETIIEGAKSKFEGSDIKVTFHIATGDPAMEIIDMAEREECDMIIICTHGMTGAKRFLIGSVASKVVHHASMPVFVIR